MSSLIAILMLFAVGAESVTEITDLHGRIESPNYPSPYEDNLNLTWVINARPGYQVVIYFTFFDIEDSYDEQNGGACAYDYLELPDVGKGLRLCGNAEQNLYQYPRILQKFRSQSNQMVINFVSDYSNEDPRPVGFVAHFYQDDKDECAEMKQRVANTVEDWDQLVYCDHFCINTPGSYYCSCRHGYSLHENLHTCKGNCKDVQLRTDSGSITTPDFPHKYSKLTDCDWNIEVRAGLSLNFIFNNTFDVEHHFNYSDCPYDWVKLTYAETEEKFCGPEAPQDGQLIRTNTRRVRVGFHSDNSVEKTGFHLSYNTSRVRCNENPQAPSNGIISSSQSRGYFEFEDQVNFECNKGYELIGAQTIVCQNDGTWSDEFPKCQIKSCADPVHLMNVAHSTLSGASSPFTYQDRVSVVCIEWYELFSGTQNWTCNENQEWVSTAQSANEVPVCKPICGIKGKVQRDFADSQVFAGRPARVGEWPWMAYIDIDGGGLNKDREFCGGSLVNERYVITAAHCFDEFTERNSKVYLGVHDRRETGDPHIQVFSVDSLEIHSRFGEYDDSELNTDFDNDIAVIRLNQSAVLNNWVRPICIPRNTLEKSLPLKSMTNDPNYDRRAAIIGWGLTGASETSTARVLQITRVPMVATSVCKNDYATNGLGITNNMLCAGFPLGGRDTCKGDSGGPLSFKWRARSKWYLNGIVSFSDSQKCGNTYGVYTRVENFLNWIDTHVQW